MNKNVDGAFKELYQLNNTKDYKTFGIRKKCLHRFVLNLINK